MPTPMHPPNSQLMSRQTFGLILAGLASASASVLSVCIKLGEQDHKLSPYMVVLARSVMLALFAVVYQASTSRRKPSSASANTASGLFIEAPGIPRITLSRLLKLGLAGFFSWATTLTTALSVVQLSMANAAMFWALAPLLGALVSPLIGESLSKATVRALPLAVIGVILVSQPPILFGGAEGKFNGLGIFLGISQAVCNAATKLSIRLLGNESIPRILLSVSLLSTIATLLQGWAEPSRLELPISAHSWWLLFFACLGGSCFQWLSAESLKRAKAAPVLAMMYSSTLWGLMWDAAVFSHWPDGMEVMGAAFIFSSSYLLISEKLSEGYAADKVEKLKQNIAPAAVGVNKRFVSSNGGGGGGGGWKQQNYIKGLFANGLQNAFSGGLMEERDVIIKPKASPAAISEIVR